MNSKHLATLCLAVSLCACSTTAPATNRTLIRHVGYDDLMKLGKRVGWHVEDHGMSNYEFTKDSRSFDVWNHFTVTRDHEPIGLPVTFRYRPTADGPLLTHEFAVAQGITLDEAEGHLRSFIREIEATESSSPN